MANSRPEEKLNHVILDGNEGHRITKRAKETNDTKEMSDTKEKKGRKLITIYVVLTRDV